MPQLEIPDWRISPQVPRVETRHRMEMVEPDVIAVMLHHRKRLMVPPRRMIRHPEPIRSIQHRLI
ncbi:MAG: hypothetical protein ACRDRD_18265, partial [Pseudonocardiaceae bacterium]